MAKFTAKLESARGGGHVVAVPSKTATAAGLAHGVRVRGNLEGTAYRSALMKSGEQFFLGVHKATIAAAGVEVGDQVSVEIEVDDEPLPTDTIPDDLAKALAAAKLTETFAALAPSHRREHVKAILDAKKPETRASRTEKAIAMLRAKGKR